MQKVSLLKQHVSGQYNLHDNTSSLFIIGNGVDDNNRSDVVRVETSGLQVTGSVNITGFLTQNGYEVKPYKIYSALLTQNSTVITSGSLTVGELYTITDYIAGDDFSNVANVQSGSINNDGCVFIATGTTPTTWTNSTGLTINALSAPVATVLENTLGFTPEWVYDNKAVYSFTSSGAFPIKRTFVYTPVTINQATNTPEFKIVDTTNFPDTFRIFNFTNGDDIYYYTPLEIKVYPPNSSFTLSSTDFTNWGSGGGVTPSGTLGFTTDGYYSASVELYNAYAFVGTKGTDIQTLFTDNGLLTNQTGYVFNVTWGAGSSISSGKVLLAVYNNDNLLIAPIYTGNNNWQTPGQNNDNIASVAGTFNFPATFSLYSPTTGQGTNWC